MHTLIDRLRKFRDERNWSQFHTSKDLAISVSIEASELLEIFQWKTESNKLSPEDILKIKDEVADVYIYLLLLCDKLNIDLIEQASLKIERNQERFPIETSKGIAKPKQGNVKP